MRRWAVRILGVGGGALLLTLSLLGLWVAGEYRRDPMPLLDQPTAPLVIRTLQESTLLTTTGEPRHLLEYELDGSFPARPQSEDRGRQPSVARGSGRPGCALIRRPVY